MRPALILAVLSLYSCSFLTTRRPEPPPYTSYPDCTDAYGRPVGDTFIAAGGLAVAGISGGAIAATGGKNAMGESTVPGYGMLIAGGVVTAAMFAVSAAVGFPRVAACREAMTEWGRGEPERQRLAAEVAEQARLQALAAAQARHEQIRSRAAELLKCPEELTFEEVQFEGKDPIRQRWGWVDVEVRGCNRAAWCGNRADVGLSCSYPSDYYLATAQLAVETGCSDSQIEPQMQQVFTRRTWQPGRGESFQVTWRLTACGKPYTCAVIGGPAANIACKAALDSAAP